MKLKISYAMFAAQVVLMLMFTVAQAQRMTQSVQGVSPTWLIFGELFCFISVGLAFAGWQKNPGRETLLLFLVHLCATVCIGYLVVFGIFPKMQEINWSWYESLASTVVVFGSALTLMIGSRYNLGITDPIIRGIIAGLFRGVPHLTMTYKISLLGGAGLAEVMVWTAHVTTLLRIGQLGFAVREAGWNRERRGNAFAEAINYTTWILVTVVWVLH